MKTVKTTADLQRLALTKGASASVGDRHFNAAQEKVVAEKKPAAEPKVEKVEPQPVAPAIAQEASTEVRDVANAVAAHVAAATEIAKSNAEVIAEMQKSLASLAEREQMHQEPVAQEPKKWRLTTVRDTRGILQSIDVTQIT